MPTQSGEGAEARCCGENNDTERSSISTTSSATSSSLAPVWPQPSSRLSKLGRRIRESCRSLRPGTKSGPRGDDGPEPTDYDSVQLPQESVRSKVYVAMDFSNKSQGGRILDNPKDVRLCSKSTMASKDGYLPFRRRIAAPVGDRLTETQATIHKIQPWYQGGMSRDKANKILAAHTGTDGVFLVRESSVAGGFVISYTATGKFIHTQVLPVVGTEGVVYSLDDGKTRFYDLLQLVEWHQLNAGPLPVRLAQYIVSQSPDQEQQGGEKEKGSREDGGGSRHTSGSSTSSSIPAGDQRPISPCTAKMAAASEISEADSAMSQDGGSDDEEQSREQQG